MIDCGYTWEVVEGLEEPCEYHETEHVCCLSNDDGHIEHECPCGASQTEY